jgi:hypothetical protein
MFPRMTNGGARIAIIALLALAIVAYGAWCFRQSLEPELGTAARATTEASDQPSASGQEKDSIDLSDSQLASVKVEPVEDHDFPVEQEAIGSIDGHRADRGEQR